MVENPFKCSWTYRSQLNELDGSIPFGRLQFGVGAIVIGDAPWESLTGTIGGTGLSLAMRGSRAFGRGAIAGSVTRAVPHSPGTGGVARAAVAASFHAARA